jgi:hypothetical protein
MLTLDDDLPLELTLPLGLAKLLEIPLGIETLMPWAAP